jgi:hypothetical protein
MRPTHDDMAKLLAATTAVATGTAYLPTKLYVRRASMVSGIEQRQILSP